MMPGEKDFFQSLYVQAMSHADKLACPYGECCDIERSEMAPCSISMHYFR